MEITREVVRKCLAIEYAALSEEVIDRVKYLLLDHIGVAIRGAQEESSAAVQRFLKRIDRAADGVPVIGTSLKAEATLATLANGAAAHAPELDDVVNAASLHPGVCVMPAALSAGCMSESTGKEMIAAITAGYEVMVKLGIALDPAAHYARGFHPTGTCGVFGSAAAAGKLARLDETQMINALGIAGSQASGLLEFLSDGTYTKRFHAGWGAHGGLIAALLARDGFTGPATVIEGKFGFLQAYSPASDPLKILTGWGAPYEVMKASIKTHACCRYKQGPIDCILKIVTENQLKADDIEKVVVVILKAGFALVAEPRDLKIAPKTIVDAQFSMPFGGAVAILCGRAFLDEYCLENITSPRVKELMERFECILDPEVEVDFPRMWPAKVDIITRDGKTYHARLDFPKGDPENPLSWDELIEKFHCLTAGVFPEEKRQRIVADVRSLERAENVARIMDLLGRSS
jgi:2-methylcitrate dehydratase PrpD